MKAISLVAIKVMQLLEIYLSPIDQRRFSAIATQSPAGGGHADSTLPFWEGEQDRRLTLLKLLELSNGFQAAAFPELGEQAWMVQAGLLTADRQGFDPAYLDTVGQALYQALLPVGSSLRSAFEASLRLAEEAEVDLHLRLKFEADGGVRSHLADYPWELIHDGQRFLLHRGLVLSRYIDYGAIAPSLSGQTPLRVLLVSSSASDPAQGMAKLGEAEQQAIRAGLAKAQAAGAIALLPLEPVTRRGLSTYLTDCSPESLPLVIHFDGHGLYGKRCSNPTCGQMHAGIRVERCRWCQQALPAAEGFLLFEDEQGGPDYVSAQEFVVLLPKGVALVVLSACQSGMAVAGESLASKAGGFNGMAQQLMDARVPAVVAMQYMVQVEAASLFAEQFYRVLAKGEPVVVALKEGRKWMMPLGNQWYRPVVYLRWRDNQGGQLFAGGVGEFMVNPSENRAGLPIMSHKLTVSQRKQLRTALLSAFPDDANLALLIEDEFGQPLNQVVNTQNFYEKVVADTIKWIESEGKIPGLINAAVRNKPDNPDLQKFVQDLSEAN